LVSTKPGGAAVILTDAPGGTGEFFYLAVVLTDNAAPRTLDTIFLGFFLVIKSYWWIHFIVD
jgi:hypothetical protein